jgi:hypothetical protein
MVLLAGVPRALHSPDGQMTCTALASWMVGYCGGYSINTSRLWSLLLLLLPVGIVVAAPEEDCATLTKSIVATVVAELPVCAAARCLVDDDDGCCESANATC